jgi:hypothetical protein
VALSTASPFLANLSASCAEVNPINMFDARAMTASAEPTADRRPPTADRRPPTASTPQL